MWSLGTDKIAVPSFVRAGISNGKASLQSWSYGGVVSWDSVEVAEGKGHVTAQYGAHWPCVWALSLGVGMQQQMMLSPCPLGLVFSGDPSSKQLTSQGHVCRCG